VTNFIRTMVPHLLFCFKGEIICLCFLYTSVSLPQRDEKNYVEKADKF
jgi:hypothetical protein